jgi:hypothetical protein
MIYNSITIYHFSYNFFLLVFKPTHTHITHILSFTGFIRRTCTLPAEDLIHKFIQKTRFSWCVIGRNEVFRWPGASIDVAPFSVTLVVLTLHQRDEDSNFSFVEKYISNSTSMSYLLHLSFWFKCCDVRIFQFFLLKKI